MVDISRKEATEREAVVEGMVYLRPEVILAIKRKGIPKGDVLEVARLAGILAAKKTPFLIPLCHSIPLEHVDINFSIEKNKVKITTVVRAKARTGVEMEALTAAAVSAITIYDMCKPLDKGIMISDLRLLKKTGGKSGDYILKKGEILTISISKKKGTKKYSVPEALLKKGVGIVGDAHAEGGGRQVSLLAIESIDKMRSKGLVVGPGDFAENITTQGLDLLSLKLGTKLKAGKAILEISQFGKKCHTRCHIYYQAGDCVMPKEGVFARVLKGGIIRPGIEVIAHV